MATRSISWVTPCSALERENVWPPISRPPARPIVTSISGIRSSFCFRVVGTDVMAVRELSCRCAHCLGHRWTSCTSTDAGKWKLITMKLTAPSAGIKTRGQRALVSAQRCALAQECDVGEIMAMESADDQEGFSFWLARVEKKAYKHQGPKTVQDGRTLIPNTWYIGLRYYDRFPTTSSSTFKLGQETHDENAEGVIARTFPFQASGRASRRNASGPSECNLSCSIRDSDAI